MERKFMEQRLMAQTIINLGRENSIRNGLVNGTRLLLYQGIFICTIV
jgi:hypothetical protein